MKKLTILAAAGVAVALAASTARAQGTNNGLTVWYDVRSSSAAILTPAAPYTNGTSALANTGKKQVANITPGNGGRAGDAAILFISPELPPITTPGLPNTGLPAQYTKKGLNPAVNNSQKNLYKYVTVAGRAPVDEVIGALGLDIDVVKGGAAGEGSAFDGITHTANGALWDGEASSVTDNGGGIDWTIETKAVRVPVAAGPVFDPTGVVPGPNSIPFPNGDPAVYQIATIAIDVSDWDKANALATPQADNMWTVRDTVNNLLVTRVYDGAGPVPELPDFGYVTNAADPLNQVTGTDEEAAGGDGSTVGTTSVQPDALIVVIPKGDYTYDNAVTTADYGGINAAITAGGAIRQRELYLGDFNESASVTTADYGGLNAMITALTADCPCDP